MKVKLVLVVSALGLFVSGTNVLGSVFTFNTSADLTSNFNLDVVTGDNVTEWHEGYSAASGYDGSDGGFVLFNNSGTGNSMQFAAGPITLISFDISAQTGEGGRGVQRAIDGHKDYRLQLLDVNLNPLLDTIMYVDTDNGKWTTETFNVANVSVIRIASREDATGPGAWGAWWPNIDNITYQAIPEPASLGLLGLVTGGIYFARRFFIA